MPLPLAHGLLGAGIVAALHPRPSTRHFAPLLLGALLANAADFDFFLVFILRSREWHRGFTHSLMFALMVGLLFVITLGGRRLRKGIAYALAFASHGVLDYVTTKAGGGVELLWPLSGDRLALGWRGLSELPSRLTGAEIVEALVVELMLFTPFLAWVIWLRKYMSKRADATKGAI